MCEDPTRCDSEGIPKLTWDERMQAQFRAVTVAQHCCDTPGLCAALDVMCGQS